MSDSTSVIDAAALGVPAVFNAATHFVDRHIDKGRGGKVAIECGDERVSYAELLGRVNQFARALGERLGVRLEERVALLLLDGPDFFYSFFGAIKAGAVAVPINCAGYWNQHEKTKQTIHGGWIRTGDKYTQDADGYYWYAGRSDDMMKVGGLWVSPIEVEHALVQHAAVQECAVVAREDHDKLVKPAAFVVVRTGHAPTPALADDLVKHVREKLADYKRPRWIEFVPELPKTATGKIQRYKLKT